jgi:hypothetical protein
VLIATKEAVQICLFDGLAHIFYNKFSLLDRFEHAEAFALGARVEDLQTLPLLSLDALIATSITGFTIGPTLFLTGKQHTRQIETTRGRR